MHIYGMYYKIPILLLNPFLNPISLGIALIPDLNDMIVGIAQDFCSNGQENTVIQTMTLFSRIDLSLEQIDITEREDHYCHF
jgi:hypothetical protein